MPSGPLPPAQPAYPQQGYYQPAPQPAPPPQWQSGPLGGAAAPSQPLSGYPGYPGYQPPLQPQSPWQTRPLTGPLVSGPLVSGPLPGYPPYQAQVPMALPPQPANYYQPVAQPVVVVQQNDSSSAVLVECICGFFGLYGIGWLMSGYTTTGIVLLICGLLWSGFVLTVLVFTAGFGGLCLGPINIALWITSALILNSKLKQRRLVVMR